MVRIIDINGYAYELHFVEHSSIDAFGDCTTPDVGNAKPGVIRISKEISGETLLDTLIHEFTHADLDQVAELYVERHGRGLAKFLIELGLINEEKLNAIKLAKTKK